MRKLYAPHLEIIREALAAIDRYRPAHQEAFFADPMALDAVLMRLQVIGEQMARIRRIDEERFAEVAPEAWFQLIGLRNVISHGYETIESARIWQMIAHQLPELSASLALLDDD